MTATNQKNPDASTISSSLLTRERIIEMTRIVLTGFIAFLYWKQLVPVYVLWIAVAIGLYPLMKTGIIELIKERKIGTEIFVTIATLVAVFGGETVAGAVLMVIILIAEFIADFNTDRARSSIKTLIGSVPTTAIVRNNGTERTIPISELKQGDVVLVRTGEKIPVDGQIIHGDASINEAPITGESIAKDKTAGDSVFAGTLIEAGALDIKTERVGADTTFGRIMALVEGSGEEAPVQKLADKVASWLIPVVLIFLVAVYFITRDVKLIVTLMIFTSPAELGLATPLVIIAAIARAARSGILIKGGIYLETLARVNTMVFDKTGTLTENKPKVVRIELNGNAASKEELLRIAAAADRRSAHPLAKSVVEHAIQKGIAVPEPQSFEQLQGKGVKAVVDGKTVLIGNSKLLRENNIPFTDEAPGAETPVYVAMDGMFVGTIFIGDTIRPNAKETLARLKKTGIKQTIMLTGDNAATAAAVSAKIGVDHSLAELLPEQKVKAIDDLHQQKAKVAMVGDGINDAPALVKADVGIAMGGGGTQAALEAADIALMTDDLSKIVTARAIARKAYRTIKENLIVGVGVVHVLGIIAALLRWIGPIQAAMIHLGPDVLVFLNSIKLLRVRIKE